MIIHNAHTMKELIGFTIVEAVEDEELDEYWGFKVKKDEEEFFVWVLRDEEGNGSGCLDVVLS